MTPEKAQELMAARAQKLKEWGEDSNEILRAAGFSREELRPLRTTWEGMRARCGNPKHGSYKYYGGKGICVCARWDQFHLFVLDMGRKPTPWHTLDRKDYDGDYTPENCRWATSLEQAQNRRNKGTSGVVGVRAQGKYWIASGYSRGRSVHLYCGESFTEAVRARQAWDRRASP